MNVLLCIKVSFYSSRVIQVWLVWSVLLVSQERRATEDCKDLKGSVEARVTLWVTAL